MHPFEAVSDAPSPSASGRSSSVAKQAAVGALWTITTSVGARAIGLVGTLALTRFLAPEVYGEVSLAAVVIQTAQMVSTCGLSQYLVSKPKEGREAAFHASFFFLALGLVALAVAGALGGVIGPWLGAPGLARYLPALAVAGVVERVATVQDRIQVREMRFRLVGMNRFLGEVTYATVTLALAARGWGGDAVLAGTMARAAVRLVFLSATTDRRAWLTPCRITWTRTRELFAFGVPMSIGAFFAFGSRRWDNLVFAGLYGPATAGIYNLAYNLADIPATQIGETIADVLVPSFAQLPPSARRPALVRALRLLLLIVAPLAVGLGVVAPALVATFFDPRWAEVAPMVLLLSALSVVRPISWTTAAYLQVRGKPRAIMALEGAKTTALLVAVALLGLLGPLWACAAVGIAFGAGALGYVAVIRRFDGVPARELIAPLGPPLYACVPMAVVVLLVGHVLTASGARPAVVLLAEVAAGAAVFLPSAFFFARPAATDLSRLLANALRRR